MARQRKQIGVITTKLKRTIFSQVQVTDLYKILFSGPITFDGVQSIVNVIQNYNIPQNALPIFDKFLAGTRNVTYLENWLRGADEALMQFNLTAHNAKEEWEINTPLVYSSIDTKLLSHVLTLGKVPKPKKIKLKTQLYNTTIWFKYKPKDENDQKKLVYFNMVLNSYNRYMALLEDEIIRAQRIMTVTDPTPLQVRMGSRPAFTNPKELILTTNSNVMAGDVEGQPMNVLRDGGQYVKSEKPNIRPNTYTDPEASDNPDQLLVLYERRKINFRRFKEEMITHFGDMITFSTGLVKLSVMKDTTYTTIGFPIIDPDNQVPNVTEGAKYAQFVITFDTEGIEPQLLSYTKSLNEKKRVAAGGYIKQPNTSKRYRAYKRMSKLVGKPNAKIWYKSRYPKKKVSYKKSRAGIKVKGKKFTRPKKK